MDLNKGMAETVAAEMPSAAEIAACRWLPDAELRVYSEEYGRTGFQGGLNGYRGSPGDADLQLFSGRTIDVPSLFIGGKNDWGVYQNPGALERLQKTLTTKMQGTHLVEGAGHWVQQEQPEAVSRLGHDEADPSRHRAGVEEVMVLACPRDNQPKPEQRAAVQGDSRKECGLE